MGRDLQPVTWREMLGRFLLRVGEGYESLMNSPARCGRCGTTHTLRELWSSRRTLPFDPPQGMHVPLFCCAACADRLRRKIEEYRGLAARDWRVAREDMVVWRNNECARAAGAVGSLTLNQWLHVLNAFEWRCAYCPDGPYQALEHVIPISRGGDTSADNCVPACTPCNAAKKDRHPDEIRESSNSPEAIRRVRAQLQRLQANMPE